MYFSGRFLATPIYRRADLPAGMRLTGPAVVEQLDSTTVIPPGVDAEVDEYLNILMHLSESRGGRSTPWNARKDISIRSPSRS